MRSLIFSAILFLLAGTFVVQAQQMVTGTVYDSETREPIPFGTVQIKGQTEVSDIDIDGRYSIYANTNDILIFTSPTYKLRTQPIDGHGVMDVFLEAEEPLYEVSEHLGLYGGAIGHMPYHFFGAFATRTSKRWGYGFDYMYSPGWAFPQNTWHKVMNATGFGIQAVKVNPSDDLWTFYPYLNVNPFDLFLKSKSWDYYSSPSPFVNVGYWFDTDFKSIGEHNIGFGGGIQYGIRQLFRIKGFPNLTVFAGYSVYAGQSSNNHFYIGLRIRPNVRPIMIY